MVPVYRAGWRLDTPPLDARRKRCLDEHVMADPTHPVWFSAQTLRLCAAGRTDTGVHARGQVIAFRTPHLTMTALQLLRAINRGLPGSIRAVDCEPTPISEPFSTFPASIDDMLCIGVRLLDVRCPNQSSATASQYLCALDLQDGTHGRHLWGNYTAILSAQVRQPRAAPVIARSGFPLPLAPWSG